MLLLLYRTMIALWLKLHIPIQFHENMRVMIIEMQAKQLAMV